jgi:NADH-quinone oxidoreductase subunit C
VTKKVKVKKIVEGEEKEVDETQEEFFPGYLEAVYHLYSMSQKQGPVIVRMRTKDRVEGVRLPSLTPIYRSAEFQEREIFDLYGVHFEGTPINDAFSCGMNSLISQCARITRSPTTTSTNPHPTMRS